MFPVKTIFSQFCLGCFCLPALRSNFSELHFRCSALVNPSQFNTLELFCLLSLSGLKLHLPPQSSLLPLISHLLSSQALPNDRNLWSWFVLHRWLKLVDVSLSMICSNQINKVNGTCVKVNLGEVLWSSRSPYNMWSWPEKKDEDCDGVLSMDLREGWHSERVSAAVAI